MDDMDLQSEGGGEDGESDELQRARRKYTLAKRQLSAMRRLGASEEVLDYHNDRVAGAKHDLTLLQPQTERLQVLLDSERSRVLNLAKYEAQVDAAEQALALARGRRDLEVQHLAAVRVDLLKVQTAMSEAADKARAPQSAGGPVQSDAPAHGLSVPDNASKEELMGFLDQLRLRVAKLEEPEHARPGAAAAADAKRLKVDELATAAAAHRDVPMGDSKPASVAGSSTG